MLHSYAGVPRSDAAQIQSALKTVQAKIGADLRAPQRPLLDIGTGLTFDLDSANASLLVCNPLLLPSLSACEELLGVLKLRRFWSYPLSEVVVVYI